MKLAEAFLAFAATVLFSTTAFAQASTFTAFVNGAPAATMPAGCTDYVPITQSSVTKKFAGCYLGLLNKVQTWTAAQTFPALSISLGTLAAQANHTILANISGGSTAPTAITLTALLDDTAGTNRGGLLERGASTWAVLTPGTVGLPLVSAGSGADPAYSALGVPGGGTGRVTLTSHGVLVGAGTSGITQLGAAAAGTLLGGVASSDPAFTATPVLGVAGTTLGSIGLSGNTSGVVTIKPQAAAGTFNFNLPITAGSSSQVLASGGGGSAPMTWTTLATVATSGSAADLGTGTLPTGRLSGSYTGITSIGTQGVSITIGTTSFVTPSSGQGTINGASNVGLYLAGNGSTADMTLANNGGSGVLQITHAATTMIFPGYLSCTALTTNGSGLLGCTVSDRRLKEDHGAITAAAALAALDTFDAHSYSFIDPKHDYGALTGEHFGFFAQDVMRVFPKLVHRGPRTARAPDGELLFDKTEMIGVLWMQNKALKASIDAIQRPNQSAFWLAIAALVFWNIVLMVMITRRKLR